MTSPAVCILQIAGFKRRRIIMNNENNVQKIKDIFAVFFSDINRVDIAIKTNQLTSFEIIEICKSFIHKFEIISDYARSEIIKRERKRMESIN